MRITYDSKLCLTLLTIAMATVSGSQATQAQNAGSDYYFVEGQRVELSPSEEYKAFALRPGIPSERSADFAEEVEASGVGEVETVPILQEYGIRLVRSKANVDESDFVSAMDALSQSPEVEAELPVYAVGEANAVLVNEFIVQFHPNVSDDVINQTIEESNASIVRDFDRIPGRYLITFNDVTPQEALSRSNALHQSEQVEFSEPNLIQIIPERPEIRGAAEDQPAGTLGTPLAPAPSATTPTDTLYSNQWGLNNTGAVGVVNADIDAPEAWDSQKGSSQTIVAIIDEGVDTQHPDLQSKIVTPYDATDGDNNQEPNSWDGHGTACAGIAVAVTNNNLGVAGVSWNSRILPVRIASSNCPGCNWITSNAIIEDGLRTAVDRGAHVLSNSWGGGSPSNAINSGIDYAIANGRTVVFAAGNDSGPVSYPGNLSTNRVIITVSATNEWDEFKTTTSQDGENWWGSNFGPQISVAAPGVHIYTTDITGSNGYVSGDYVSTFNGTSSATPFVAGAAALVLSQNPSMTPAEVRDLLQQTADDLGASGFDNQFGNGRLNVGNSFKKVAGKADMVVWRPSDGTWYARLSGGDWNATISRQWGLAGDIPLANTDFDGDGKADMGVWRPSDGTWYARLSGGDWNATISRQWGLAGDIPLANTDFDGDGKADMGVWRPSDGTWYARLSGGDWNATISRQWGLAGDIPLANTDFDGDGKADMGVWRPSDGTWYARLSGGDWNATISRQWGLAGDIPLANTDFDGDGKADMGVWRPSDGTWYARLSGGDWNATISRQWGLGGDIPLASTDFDGDGKADIGVWRPSDGTWYARLSGGDWNATISRQWGLAGDIPLANTDFDGDGKADMGVWRPSDGTWYARLSGGDWNSTISRQWGLGGDIPLSSTDLDGDAVTPSAAALYVASGTAEGEVAAVNLDTRSLTLIDGSAFNVRESVSLEELKPGAEVSVLYEQVAGERRATAVTQR